MSDELGLPEVPEAKPDDLEDVSWALSTAEAMWARGDHADGIKWVRRAAEAASEADEDIRALELAKAAADLTNLIARKASRASIDLEEVDPISEKSPPPVPPARAPAVPKSVPASVTKQVSTPSRPPAPLPSRTSQPPPGRGKPLGTNTGRPPSVRPGAPRTSERPPSKRGRRSRENLDELAKAALAPSEAQTSNLAWPASETVEHPAATPAGNMGAAFDTSETDAIDLLSVRRTGDDPTIMSNVSGVLRPPASRPTTEWDSPTQDFTGDDLPFPILHSPPSSASALDDGDRKTALAIPGLPGPVDPVSSTGGTNPPATVAYQPPSPSGSPHAAAAPPPAAERSDARNVAPRNLNDAELITSQAVRVVVWRDAHGVQVAPAGTIVSAITVDAVLVALEPNADLTAWLSQKNR